MRSLQQSLHVGQNVGMDDVSVCHALLRREAAQVNDFHLLYREARVSHTIAKGQFEINADHGPYDALQILATHTDTHATSTALPGPTFRLFHLFSVLCANLSSHTFAIVDLPDSPEPRKTRNTVNRSENRFPLAYMSSFLIISPSISLSSLVPSSRSLNSGALRRLSERRSASIWAAVRLSSFEPAVSDCTHPISLRLP